MSPGKRRGRRTIMAQILNIAREETLKTQIMYRANLSFAQLNEYLDLLLEVKLLKVNTEEGRTIYRTTSKGVKYLEHMAEIERLESIKDRSGGRGSLTPYLENIL